jgi:hypothetical protein
LQCPTLCQNSCGFADNCNIHTICSQHAQVLISNIQLPQAGLQDHQHQKQQQQDAEQVEPKLLVQVPSEVAAVAKLQHQLAELRAAQQAAAVEKGVWRARAGDAKAAAVEANRRAAALEGLAAAQQAAAREQGVPAMLGYPPGVQDAIGKAAAAAGMVDEDRGGVDAEIWRELGYEVSPGFQQLQQAEDLQPPAVDAEGLVQQVYQAALRVHDLHRRFLGVQQLLPPRAAAGPSPGFHDCHHQQQQAAEEDKEGSDALLAHAWVMEIFSSMYIHDVQKLQQWVALAEAQYRVLCQVGCDRRLCHDRHQAASVLQEGCSKHLATTAAVADIESTSPGTAFAESQ